MISQYSINYPVLAALGILIMLGLYHLLRSRKQEFETLHIPSSTVMATSQNGICIHHEQDVSINGLLHFDQLICKNLYVGPYACLQGNLIRAHSIVIEGEIKHVEQIVAHIELTNLNYMEATRIDVPKMTLGRKSVSIVQIVPKQTKIERKRGAQSRGFFSSAEEFEQAKNGSGPKNKPNLASIRLVRRGTH